MRQRSCLRYWVASRSKRRRDRTVCQDLPACWDSSAAKVCRAVAQNAAGRTGLDPTLLKKMLPMLAMLAAGYLSKQRGSLGQAAQTAGKGGLGGMLGQALGQRSQAGSTGSGGSGLVSMLDLDGDGNPLDDIIGMAGKMFR